MVPTVIVRYRNPDVVSPEFFHWVVPVWVVLLWA